MSEKSGSRVISVNSQSNPGVTYEVCCTIEFRENTQYASMRCNCPASAFHEIVCKHEKAILSGDTSMLSHPGDVSVVQEVSSIFMKTTFWKSFVEFEKEIKRLEREKKKLNEEIRKQKNKAKDAIGTLLADGVPLK